MNKVNLSSVRFDTEVLKALAVFFVVLSHIDAFLPSAIRPLATGGALGNSLFFFASGYGLWFSLKSTPDITFSQWLHKRCSRIYPSYWGGLVLTIPVLWLIGAIQFNNVLGLASHIFYPLGIYWFLRAILIFYIVIFLVFKVFPVQISSVKTILILSIISYLAVYCTVLDLDRFVIESLPFRLIFYFIVMMLGMLAAERFKTINWTAALAIVIIGFVSVYVSKYLLTKSIATETQLIQHVGIIAFCWFMLSVARTKPGEVMYQISPLKKAIKFMSDHCLEIYLVHLPVTFVLKHYDLVSFPYLFVMLIVSGFGAYYLRIMVKRVSK
ncbi:acyltransferase family protein [Catenovulum sp. 2E275]|uniref:acyltransferase family protein n=1 Tax=Catenovulum sp. 2E275 TaxID=2980497 RepID=UPI0021CDF156|nr:acyltransferase family protein [Catenovulum sp. 2E275]MCU4674818.1 acyltransferase family protein [Catenovulum sp. 2E275]